MRVLWTHNFDPRILNKGSFMHAAADGLRARGVELHLHYLGNLRSPLQLWRAGREIKRLSRRFDLVHAQFGSACTLATAAAEGVPKLVTIRGNDWATHNSSFGFHYFHTRAAMKFTRSAISSYDCVCTVSHRLAAAVSRVVPTARIVVLPSPIDLGAFVPRNKLDAKAALGAPMCTEKWVLFNSVDLHSPVKRFQLAKAAFDLAQATRGGLRLRLATNLPHAAIAQFVAACDLILCTSESEGWPNSVKEALACDVPFVATDVSDLSVIAAQEPSCRICPADARVIAANICEVLAGPQPVGLRKHVEGMSVDAITDRLIATYQSVLVDYRVSRPVTAGLENAD
jgi:glycosyltransferase involved in cell wall biosynthesis